MYKTRGETYPFISYVFMTRNSKQQVSRFLQKYKYFQNRVNIIEHTKEIALKFYAHQCPECLLVDQDNFVIYQGTPSLSKCAPMYQNLNALAAMYIRRHIAQSSIPDVPKRLDWNAKPEAVNRFKGGNPKPN